MPQTTPTQTRIVLTGGCAIGISIAYHNCRTGGRDVVHLVWEKLTSGTGRHAAGLIASFDMSTETLTRIELNARQLKLDLPIEACISTGLRQCGHIHQVCGANRR